MVQDISFQNEQYGSEPKRSPVEVFDPRPSTLQRTTKADIQECTDSLNSLEVPCRFIHLLSRPTEALLNSERQCISIEAMQSRMISPSVKSLIYRKFTIIYEVYN